MYIMRMFIWMFVFFSALTVQAQSNYNRHEVPAVLKNLIPTRNCTNSSTQGKCAECVNYSETIITNSGPVTQILDYHSKNEDILFNFSENPTITWKFDATHFFPYYHHIHVTFHIKEPFGPLRLLPGCCFVSLKKGNCLASENINGVVYYKLSLYRASVTKRLASVSFTAFPNILDGSRFFNFESTTNTSRILPPTKPPRIGPPAVWLDRIKNLLANKFSYVCLFQAPKESIRKTSTLSQVESHLFKRDVYNVNGYRYHNDTIVSSYNNAEVDCETQVFNQSDLFNKSFNEGKPTTYTCLLQWLSIDTSNNVPVLCMDHEVVELVSTATPETSSSKKVEKESENAFVIIIGSVVGAMLLLIVIISLAYFAKKAKKFMKSVQDIPADLVTAVNNDKMYNFDERMSEEKVTPYDENEITQLKEIMMKRQPPVGSNIKKNNKMHCVNEEDASSLAAKLCACSLVSENNDGDKSYNCWNEYCNRDFGCGSNYEYMLNRESGMFSLASSISSASNDSKTKDDPFVDKLKLLLSNHFLDHPDKESQHQSPNGDNIVKDQNNLCGKLNSHPCLCITYNLKNACNKLHRERSSGSSEECIRSRANSVSDSSGNSSISSNTLNFCSNHQHVASVSKITDNIANNNAAQLTPTSGPFTNAAFVGYSSKNDFADPATDITVCN